jgi:hypothetical protein
MSEMRQVQLHHRVGDVSHGSLRKSEASPRQELSISWRSFVTTIFLFPDIEKGILVHKKTDPIVYISSQESSILKHDAIIANLDPTDGRQCDELWRQCLELL